MKYPLIAAGLCAASMAAAEAPVLTVYAPDYFASEWGPGPGIEAGFEERCACDLQFITGDVLPRLLLEGERTEADAVIGLNTDVTLKARESGLFGTHGQDTSGLTLPIEWSDDVFLPFDWSYLSFVYDNTKLENPPTSFEALLEMPDDVKIVIQDPRSSISGLGLLLWVKSVYGDDAENAWTRLAPKILTVTKGWSEAYGMFTDGEADMVLSFTTSPAYHIIAEEDLTKSAAIFDEGHYVLVELAGKIATTDQPELADSFMEYVLSEEFQSMIPTSNWSYPAQLDAEKLPAQFLQLGTPEKAIFLSEQEANDVRDGALEEWRNALSQ
ncbi:thiamine ABC transporter substrate binding subunit [Pseudohalocynthiibacter aestuariivivens]|jgi:thiamine transport system substrate-binding protein|uniref:Thiamine ABC transporter substrate binding subunit n=1 Tax=Pseudohalocynthiibacter aestuariivivens TaxID=1591409 RepID=A0ABV5JJK8_9RHOB|nr:MULTISPECIES: thiamine ABC transporter substrate binding subunit [Pseudohalocynthiibacter]MBS9718236.1 thiamine ABC transporter substrate binding subunit [Pseudohalocynthiibacter aestuariivivens]MCK0103459.1 thiamine ABC transporter substrate-binding protein [Pseudohalocynthiibacter sp. F2068]